MTPGERDEVLRIAAGFFACEPKDALTLAGMIKLCNAILRYVPPGDAAAPAGFTLQPVAATADTPASVVTVSPKGRFWPLDVEMARQMGAAYMAAADAAEED